MAEMSGRWLSNGRELTVDEFTEWKRQSKIARTEQRFVRCKKSLLALERALGLKTNSGLAGILRQIDLAGSADFYHPPRFIQKPEGGTRIIISPKPELQLVQKRIHRLLMETFSRPPHAFGYRGGSCIELAQRHKDSQSTLKFDVKDAFFRIGYARLRRAIRGYKCYEFTGERFKWLPGFTPGFSRPVAHWIARLCTYSPVPETISQRLPLFGRSFLPQGAPTSPICFDLGCSWLDRKLAKIAKRVGGIMSRYADNYYFSMPDSEISPKLEAMIVCTARRRSGFPIHKLRVVHGGELCKILGYNLESGKIRNTRRFHRRLRGALHVLQTRLDRRLAWEDAYRRVKGFIGFAVALPNKLQQTYDYCERKIASL